MSFIPICNKPILLYSMAEPISQQSIAQNSSAIYAGSLSLPVQMVIK